MLVSDPRTALSESAVPGRVQRETVMRSRYAKRDRLEVLRLAAIIQCVVDRPRAHDEDATERDGQGDCQRH